MRFLFRSLLSIYYRLAIYAGLTVTLKPRQQLERRPLGQSMFEWMMTGNDPQFEVALPYGCFPAAGRYRLSLEVARGWNERTPHLYVDSSKGYNEAEVIPLRCRLAGGATVVAPFTLRVRARRLRLDPRSHPGKISIGRVRLRKMGRPEYYAGLAKRHIVRFVNDSGSISLAAQRAARVVRESGLRALASDVRAAQQRGATSDMSYERWIALHELADQDVDGLRKQLNALADQPMISVLMPVYNPAANCPASAPMRQIQRIEEGRISGSS